MFLQSLNIIMVKYTETIFNKFAIPMCIARKKVNAIWQKKMYLVSKKIKISIIEMLYATQNLLKCLQNLIQVNYYNSLNE